MKKNKVQTVANDEFPFLDMKMSWFPEGDLKFGVFRNKRQQLKYVGKGINHTPGTLRAITSGFQNRLANPLCANPVFNPKGWTMSTLITQMTSMRQA